MFIEIVISLAVKAWKYMVKVIVDKVMPRDKNLKQKWFIKIERTNI